MFRRIVSPVVALSLAAACAVQPSVPVPAAPAEPVEYGPSEEAITAGGLATGAVLALIAVAAIAGTASFVFISDP